MSDKYIDINFAKLDIERQKRRGASEAVFCECKTDEQLIKIFTEFKNNGQKSPADPGQPTIFGSTDFRYLG